MMRAALIATTMVSGCSDRCDRSIAAFWGAGFISEPRSKSADVPAELSHIDGELERIETMLGLRP